MGITLDWTAPIAVQHCGILVPAKVVAGPDKDGDRRVSFGTGDWRCPRGVMWFRPNGMHVGKATGVRVIEATSVSKAPDTPKSVLRDLLIEWGQTGELSTEILDRASAFFGEEE